MTTSPARLALIRALQTVPAEFIARACGVTPRAVRRWAAGERVPGKRERVALVRFQCAPDAWR